MTDEALGAYEVVPVAARLGLTCPACGSQLEDRLGPFWCPGCQTTVSAWTVLAARFGHASHQQAARLLENLHERHTGKMTRR